MTKNYSLLCLTAGFVIASAAPVHAQDAAPLKQEEIEQLVAPIALYPDSLIAQILMASTYPLEVVQAERFAGQNQKLEADALTKLLEEKDWDPSVKSLVNFPQVLSMMSEKLDWTTGLGDAFLAQQKDVMDAIQRLRGKAKAEGNLESTEQQTVVVTEEADTQVIVIESSDPEVIYVPTYNPTVVYGTWPYPAYPPYYYYPPGYVATAAISFGVGVACGAAWAHAWGDCNWGHGDIDIDARSFESNRFNSSRNTNIRNRNNGRGKWQHDPSHRKGTPYRDQNTASRFGGQSSRQAAQARDSFRGRAEAGRRDIARGGADQFRGQSGAAPRDRAGAGNRQQPTARQQPSSRQQPGNRAGGQNRNTTPDRSRQSQANRPTQGGQQSRYNRPSQSGRSSAFDGSGQGNRARQDSQRGQSSRQASRSSPSRSGGQRSSASRGPSGGGARGGGARGGGGRGGGGRR